MPKLTKYVIAIIVVVLIIFIPVSLLSSKSEKNEGSSPRGQEPQSTPAVKSEKSVHNDIEVSPKGGTEYTWVEVDASSLGVGVLTEVKAAVSGKSAYFIDGQIFYGLKFDVLSETLVVFVGYSTYDSTVIGSVYTLGIAAYTVNDKLINSVVSITAS